MWRFLKRIRAAAASLSSSSPDEALARARARRRNAPVRAELPDLGPALREYEQNLEALIEAARARKLRVIFMTQPTLWKPSDMTAEETETLMFGFVGRGLREATAYYTPAALAEGIGRYNAVTRRVCARHEVECVDLAGNLKQDLSLLYDDCHFNSSGADQVARLLAAHLLGKPPFAPALSNENR
jgi:lysophospholipase L1-like esterase